MIADTTSAEFFESKYQNDPDPWAFATDSYEQQRYLTVIASLEGRCFSAAFEPGCSIGVLTSLLAPHCQRLLAIDLSPTAVARARHRCMRLPNVDVRVGGVPGAIPDTSFDLIVFSEIGYYFGEDALERLTMQLSEHLEIGGVFIAAHWRGHSSDHLLSGDRVHEIVHSTPLLQLDKGWRYPGFRIDRLVRM